METAYHWSKALCLFQADNVGREERYQLVKHSCSRKIGKIFNFNLLFFIIDVQHNFLAYLQSLNSLFKTNVLNRIASQGYHFLNRFVFHSLSEAFQVLFFAIHNWSFIKNFCVILRTHFENLAKIKLSLFNFKALFNREVSPFFT